VFKDGVCCPAPNTDLVEQFSALESGLRDGESLTFHRDTGLTMTDVRRATCHTPYMSSENWGVHNNSYTNMVRAIMERVFLVKLGGKFQRPPTPTVSVRKKLRRFKRALLNNLENVQPMTTEQFVDTYVGRKRANYQRAVESLAVLPVSIRDAIISAFIKDEKTNFGAKPNACPRIIQPRSARFNVAIGVYLKALEKPLFRAIAAVFRGVTVFKGLNSVQRGYELRKKWNKFTKPVAVFLDAKRWDQHCNPDIIDWEHELEEDIFPEIRPLNELRKTNVCFARAKDGYVKYKVKGCRMSGDMDTAMGNCLTMCAITWTVLRDIGIRKYEYANDGDDGVLMIEEEDLDTLRKEFVSEFSKYGFTMKWEGQTEVFEEIEFCQCHPVWDGGRWIMCRDPRVAMSKDSLTLKSYRNLAELEELRRSVAWCGLAIAGQLPIFWKFYAAQLQGVDRPPPACDERAYRSGMEYLAHGMERKIASEPTDSCRLSFWKAFHISPDEQYLLETILKPIPVLAEPTPAAYYYTDNTIEILVN